jgi:hypothetical protein
MTLTCLAAHHLLSPARRDFSPEVRAKAASCLLDFLSCCMGARAIPPMDYRHKPLPWGSLLRAD